MSWRIVYLESAHKISYNLNHLQVHQDGESYFVPFDEIAVIVIENPFTILTTKVLAELAESGIPVVVLGNNHLPIGEYQPYINNVRTPKKYKEQFEWKEEKRKELWQNIVKNKIDSEIVALERSNKIKKIEVLKKLRDEVEKDDISNREGTSARVYFKEMFGEKFKRDNDDFLNSSLNFGYHVMRSLIAREIISRGYTCVFGIKHKSEYNLFNLADDVIEVYRAIIDFYVLDIVNYYIKTKDTEKLNRDVKISILKIFNYKCGINKCKYTLINSITEYLNGIFKFLEDVSDKKQIKDACFPYLLEDPYE